MSLTGAQERTAAGLTSLTLHWYSIWLIGYHGERNALPAVSQMATQMVAWRGGAPPPDVATVPVPAISHPVFVAWWPRLKLWVVVTRYIIRVRLSCYYEAVQFVQKALIVILGTASRLGLKTQAAGIVSVYAVFAFISFWVSPYRPVEVRLPVSYTLLRLLLFPFFMQVPGWMLSEESRRKADAGTDPEWIRKPQGSWFPYCEYYRETLKFSNALNIADVTGKLVLGGTVLASSFKLAGATASAVDVVLVGVNLSQIFYSLAPILVRFVGVAASDFPPPVTADESGEEVELISMFCGLKTVAATSPLLEYPTPLGPLRGRTAVLLHMLSTPVPTFEDCMRHIRVHSTDAGLIKSREEWSMMRKENYKHQFESAVKKVLAELEVRKTLIESALKGAKRRAAAEAAAAPPTTADATRVTLASASPAAPEDSGPGDADPQAVTEAAASPTHRAPVVVPAATQVAELQAELQKVTRQLDELVAAFGATQLGELKDGSTTEWSVFCTAVDSITGAQRSKSQTDANPHLTALGGGILLLVVVAIGVSVSRKNPNFFAKAPPPPATGVLAPPPPIRVTNGGR